MPSHVASAVDSGLRGALANRSPMPRRAPRQASHAAVPAANGPISWTLPSTSTLRSSHSPTGVRLRASGVIPSSNASSGNTNGVGSRRISIRSNRIMTEPPR